MVFNYIIEETETVNALFFSFEAQIILHHPENSTNQRDVHTPGSILRPFAPDDFFNLAGIDQGFS